MALLLALEQLCLPSTTRYPLCCFFVLPMKIDLSSSAEPHHSQAMGTSNTLLISSSFADWLLCMSRLSKLVAPGGTNLEELQLWQ